MKENAALKELCRSKNGLAVLYDPVYSHAATHLEDTPQLADLLIELIGAMELTEDRVAKHFNMDRVVGTCDVVDVDSEDTVVYAFRKNRLDDGLVPFTTSKAATPCKFVTVQLSRRDNTNYILNSA